VITVGFNNIFIQNFSSVTIQTQGLVLIMYGIEMYELGLVLIYTTTHNCMDTK